MPKRKTPAALASPAAPVQALPIENEDFDFEDEVDILEEDTDEGSKHYIYRFTGPTSTSKRELVGRVDDVPRPDPHDVGTAYGAGLYAILTKCKVGGVPTTKTSRVFRVSEDYGRPRTSAPAAPAATIAGPAAPLAGAPAGDMAELIKQFKDMAEMMKSISPAGGTSESLSLKGLKELLETQSLIMKTQRDMMFSNIPMQIMSLFTGKGGGESDGGGVDIVSKLLAGFVKPDGGINGQNKPD